MKAFTVHDVFKIARYTDAPCTRPKSLLDFVFHRNILSPRYKYL